MIWQRQSCLVFTPHKLAEPQTINKYNQNIIMTFPLAKFCVVGHVEYYYLQLYIHENCSVISYAVISDLAEAANLREKNRRQLIKSENQCLSTSVALSSVRNTANVSTTIN